MSPIMMSTTRPAEPMTATVITKVLSCIGLLTSTWIGGDSHRRGETNCKECDGICGGMSM